MAPGRPSSLRAALAARLRRRLGIAPLADSLERLDAGVGRDFGRAWELLDGHEERLARLERGQRLATVMAWIEQATLAREPLVSVVMPTRDRARLLERSIGSVLAQRYENWELLVCDDGSADDTAATVGSLGDPRVRHLPGEPRGPGAARNRGLAAAGGELIAYLDDDNRMHPAWLRSIAWAFEQRPDTDVLYGAIVIDDTARHHGEPGVELPSLWLERFDRERILRSNVADSSAIAHRAGLAAARWDESLAVMGDWDLILRLAAEHEPLALPAIACFYHSDADGRLSDRRAEHRRIRPRADGRGLGAGEG